MVWVKFRLFARLKIPVNSILIINTSKNLVCYNAFDLILCSVWPLVTEIFEAITTSGKLLSQLFKLAHSHEPFTPIHLRWDSREKILWNCIRSSGWCVIHLLEKCNDNPDHDILLAFTSLETSMYNCTCKKPIQQSRLSMALDCGLKIVKKLWQKSSVESFLSKNSFRSLLFSWWKRYDWFLRIVAMVSANVRLPPTGYFHLKLPISPIFSSVKTYLITDWKMAASLRKWLWIALPKDPPCSQYRTSDEICSVQEECR